MAADDLRELERDVETARAKLTGDIAALRSPNVFSEFTQNLKQTALETRDTFLDDARSRTRSAVEDAVETIKEKAVANPAAALVIGAGIAWHLIRRPPVAVALIGGGLFSLLRTNAAPHAVNGKTDPLVRARENLKEQAQDLAATAGEMGRQAADAARDKMSGLSEAAGEKAAELRAAAADKVSELREAATVKVSALTHGAKEAVGHAPLVGSAANDDEPGPQSYFGLPGEQPEDEDLGREDHRGGRFSTDKLLLGAAGIAVAAAIATIYQRRHSETTD
jgi:ElaB/YqjD/DUF883 family membrane-anchored ribosome-binding protein